MTKPNVWRDLVFWNNNTGGSLTLTLDDLKAGLYQFTSYSFANNVAGSPGSGDSGVADVSVDTGSGFVDTGLNVTLGANASPDLTTGQLDSICTVTVFFTVANDNDPIKILYNGLAGNGGDSFGLNGFLLSTAAPDTDPPTPDPPTFALAPTALSPSAVVMQATAANDVSGVEYYFAETSGAPGGTDSGWQDSSFYIDTGLSADTTYRYTLQVRDKSPAQNATAVSAAASIQTPSFAVDFSRNTVPGPDQVGFNIFAFDGSATHVESYASAIASDGTVEVTIAGTTHYRDYAAISGGSYASLSDLLSDMALRNANGTMTLTLGDLSAGEYSITLYHHSSQFGNGSFSVRLTDSLVTNELKFSGNASHGTSPTSITAVTFPFTSNGGNVVISMTGGSGGQHLTLNGFALTKPFVGTVVRFR